MEAIKKLRDNNIFNDQSISDIPKEKIVSNYAYVLIYQQYEK